MTTSSVFRFSSLLCVGTSLLVVGCATAAAPPQRPPELEHTMVELRAQNAGYVRQIEELQNRIFILEDKVDTRSASVERQTPRPMSKRIGAEDRVSSLAAPELPGDENGVVVEYAGEAALPARRGHGRLVLHLSGNGRPTVAMADDTSSTPTEGSHEPLRLYHEGLASLRSGHDAAALTTFHKFLTRYPHHDYADNVQYFTGECYYDLKQYRAAVREYRRVIERYPHGNKVPDAMLKLGYAHLALGDRREGREALEVLQRTYPKKAASRLASERLAQAEDKTPATVSLEMNGR